MLWAPADAAPESIQLVGPITNTTRDVSAPGKFELTFEGETIRGFLTLEAPLGAGRWPVEGTRRGAWCEMTCAQTSGTRIVFRGVLSATELRGTFIVGGGGAIVQYGRFQAAAAAAPSMSGASPAAPGIR